MAALEKGPLFDPKLVADLVNKVKGESTLAVLSQQTPVPFNGQKEFVFTMDNEIDVVAESGKKSHGGVSLTPRTIVPIKFEYGARVSDEFVYAAEEEKIFTTVRGTSSDGYPIHSVKKPIFSAIQSRNPEALRMPTATIRPDRVGNISTAVFKPLFAPFTNSE